MRQSTLIRLGPGDPVPSFTARGAANPHYAFDSIAGRYVVVSFIGGARVAGNETFLRQLASETACFDDSFASIFLVSSDLSDEREGRLKERYPGIRVFWDDDGNLARLFGCLDPSDPLRPQLRLTTWILDPALRVLDVIPNNDPSTHLDAIRQRLNTLPLHDDDREQWAPILAVPNVIEPELCRELIGYAERRGLSDSGFMTTDPVSGLTVGRVDHSHKRRSDCSIEDEDLRLALRSRIERRLVPQIERAFQFKATRLERYIVSCYDAATGGFFRAHKDNTTRGTAHRRFSVSIGLDAEGYVGGDLVFPEFGRRTYRPATGGAVVFSCSLLHAALPVTRGKRYAVLPFLYDDAAEAVRVANARFLDDATLREGVLAASGRYETGGR